jgi:hypothetical protein
MRNRVGRVEEDTRRLTIARSAELVKERDRMAKKLDRALRVNVALERRNRNLVAFIEKLAGRIARVRAIVGPGDHVDLDYIDRKLDNL